jgi:hypothetical protein
VEEREVRAGTIACALEGWDESGVRADMAGKYLPRHWTQPKISSSTSHLLATTN